VLRRVFSLGSAPQIGLLMQRELLATEYTESTE